jgi:hypothetical protein
MFKNSSVETLKIGDPMELAGLGGFQLNSFTQPAIGSNVTVSINQNSTYNGDFDVLTVGDEYALWAGTRWTLGVAGVYKLISTSNSSYSAGTNLVFQRIQSNQWNLGSQVPAGGIVSSSSNIVPIVVKHLDASAYIANNTFFDPAIRRQDGSLAYPGISSNGIQVLMGCSGTVTGNKFVGAKVAFGTGLAWYGGISQSIIGNIFTVQSELSEQSSSSGEAVQLYGSNAIVANNVFYAKDSKDVQIMVRIGSSENCYVVNNSFIISNPQTVPNKTTAVLFNNVVRVATKATGSSVLQVTGHKFANNKQIRFPAVNGGSISPSAQYFVRDIVGDTFRISETNNGSVFDIGNLTSAFVTDDIATKALVVDNYIQGFDHYAYCDPYVAHTIGPFYGNINAGIALSNTPISVVRQLSQSSDGSNWMLRVTNGGELELFK